MLGYNPPPSWPVLLATPPPDLVQRTPVVFGRPDTGGARDRSAQVQL